MCCVSVCVHVCVCSLCRLHLWTIYCDFLEENRCDHKRRLTEWERDEVENENERETLSKHGRKMRRQIHPYLLCRGWDSQTAGQVCLLLVWSMTPCHGVCYVDFFLCQKKKCWDTFKFHEQDLPDYSGHHLNKVFSCNSQNKSPWVYVAEYIA